MPWLQAHLTVDKGQAPLVELLFEELGALSVSLLDAADEPMLEPAPGEQPLWTHTRVSGLFDTATDADELRSRINQTLNADLSRQLELEVLEDQAWERAWLERFRPMRFGRRLWVCPHGQEPENGQAADPIIVRLDPGLAFGTGTHPTTALCLQWLDQANAGARNNQSDTDQSSTDRPRLAGARVIDFGCGSGILAIAAAKLGAAEVLAVDHDPQAVIATRDNAERNGVAERIRALHSAEFEPAPVDLVLANILSNVLIERAPQLTALVGNNGQLVLSGILAEQAAGVAKAFSPTINFQPPQTHDGWVLLAGHRRIE